MTRAQIEASKPAQRLEMKGLRRPSVATSPVSIATLGALSACASAFDHGIENSPTARAVSFPLPSGNQAERVAAFECGRQQVMQRAVAADHNDPRGDRQRSQDAPGRGRCCLTWSARHPARGHAASARADRAALPPCRRRHAD
jgi:hypothetical protein